MKYEICKKLKDSGFPTLEWKNDVYFREVKTPFTAIENARYNDGMIVDYYRECVQIPPLARIIDVLGTRFHALEQKVLDGVSSTWVAYSNEKNDLCISANIYAEGDTASEAVANLYINLHNNSATPS